MSFFALAPIVFVAFVVEATAGFGSVMISLAVGTLLWPVSELLPVIVAVSLCLSTYMVLRHRRAVEFQLILKVILPIMGAGVIVGFILSPFASAGRLRALLGVIVIAAALRGLKGLLAPRRVEKTPHALVSGFWIGFAGVVHGLLACHSRVSERNFRIAIFTLLIVAGGLLLLPMLLKRVHG